MISPARLLRRLRSLFTSRRFNEELDEEMRLHVAMEAESRMRAGADERLAREAARRAFGVMAQHRDAARDERGVRPVEDALHDVRIGVRMLTKQRTYAVVVIATLAIGIGATTALWAAVYRVLLQPFPFAQQDRIVTVWQTDTRSPSRTNSVAPANFLDWKERARSFDLLAAAEPFGFDYVGREGPETFDVALVTQDFFPIQGLAPLLGRTFRPDEFTAGRSRVVMLTEKAWRTRFGADSAIVGRTISLDGSPSQVVGVMPEGALAPFDAEMWAPEVIEEFETRSRADGYWRVYGRLTPGVTIDAARADMDRVARELAEANPATNQMTGAAVVSLRDDVVGDARRALLVLFGAAAFVMLIACVNVANLQLGECLRRRRELAVRTAIGAGGGRLVRQLLVESGLVAGIGALAGLGIAQWGIVLIRRVAPSDLALLQGLTLNGPTLAFALVLAAVCAIAITIPPIIAASRIELAGALAAGRRAGGGSVGRAGNRLLVVSEVALALVLMVGAGLLVRSLSVLLRTNAGFDARNVAVTSLQAWDYFPTPETRAQFVREATEGLAALPGVIAAGMGSSLPLAAPIGQERARIEIEGAPVAPGAERPTVRATAATAGYFRALAIPLVAGRTFGPTDIAGTTPVALVNAAFVRRFFPDGNPIGKRVTFGLAGAPATHEVVGVVGDVRQAGLQEDPAPAVYVPHAQAPTGAMTIVLKVQRDPASFEKAIRGVIGKLNGSMPIAGITSMEALVDRSLRQRRFQMGLLTAFSSIALLLAAIGIYGIMNRATTERTQEIGVRLAIGAEAGDVRWMVLRNGGALAGAGIVIGFVLAVALTRYMAGMLFGVTALDPLTYLGAAAVLLLAGVLATWVPAWRASRVDPVVALRNE